MSGWFDLDVPWIDLDGDSLSVDEHMLFHQGLIKSAPKTAGDIERFIAHWLEDYSQRKRSGRILSDLPSGSEGDHPESSEYNKLICRGYKEGEPIASYEELMVARRRLHGAES